MHKVRMLVAVPVAFALAAVMSAPAGAASQAGDVDTPLANVISLDSVVFNGDAVGTVTFTYQCVGSESAELWVSLKQPRAGVPATWDLSSEGTSQLSRAWDSRHVAMPCSKGARPAPQQATIQVVDEYTWFSDSPIETGPVFVQLCLTTPAGQVTKTHSAHLMEDSSPAAPTAVHYEWIDAVVPTA
jgi:hypothetical protein